MECVRELVAVEGVDLDTRDSMGVRLEEVARRRGLDVWQVVREERGSAQSAWNRPLPQSTCVWSST